MKKLPYGWNLKTTAWASTLVLGLTCALSCTSLRAQASASATTSSQQPASVGDAPQPISTVRIYTNLEQIPVLVLSFEGKRIKPVDLSAFRIKLDSGPWFAPKYVRQEGDDPLSLAILIDTSKPKNELLPGLAQAIAALAPQYLHPQDRVAVYQFDCNLIRTMYFKPADSAALKEAVDRALEGWRAGRERKTSEPSCKASMPLFDSMAKTVADLGLQGGRRVLLVVTDGPDQGSRATWTQVMNRAQTESVAMFGLTANLLIQTKSDSLIAATVMHHSPLLKMPLEQLSQIYELSGGLQIEADQRSESWKLTEFAQMVRERYILEYPRGRDRKAGVHNLQVSLGRDDLLIRPSGNSAPVASEEERKGANVVSSGPAAPPVERKANDLPPSPQ